RSREIFQLTFRPENFQRSRMEIKSWRDAPPTEEQKAELRRALELVGRKDITDDAITEAWKHPTQLMFEAETERLAIEFSARLRHMVWLLYEAGMKIVELGFLNDFRRRTGQRARPLDEMIEMLEPYWKVIKEHLNVAPGGRQNVRHKWSPADYICLDVQYERLK